VGRKLKIKMKKQQRVAMGLLQMSHHSVLLVPLFLLQSMTLRSCPSKFRSAM